MITQPIPNAGVYRAHAIGWQIQEYDSGSACLTLQFMVEQAWDDTSEMWSEPWPEGYTSIGRMWFRKKDGSLNEKTIMQMADLGILGDHDLLDITGDETPPQVTVHIDVQEESYEGKTSLRVRWVNENADKPRTGGLGKTDPDAAERLRAELGSQIKALLASRSKPAPSGAPAPPPAPSGDTEDPPM